MFTFFVLRLQCGIDLWTVAQSYVFFEKIILRVSSEKGFFLSIISQLFGLVYNDYRILRATISDEDETNKRVFCVAFRV